MIMECMLFWLDIIRRYVKWLYPHSAGCGCVVVQAHIQNLLESWIGMDEQITKHIGHVVFTAMWFLLLICSQIQINLVWMHVMHGQSLRSILLLNDKNSFSMAHILCCVLVYFKM